ncbi:MAG: hypothetical protein IPJ71_19870 [Bdellovibrionales bacterium]|nr:hypothetical protein [Bdellovibrionales bacterium]
MLSFSQDELGGLGAEFYLCHDTIKRDSRSVSALRVFRKLELDKYLPTNVTWASAPTP